MLNSRILRTVSIVALLAALFLPVLPSCAESPAWSNYTNTDSVRGLSADADYLWAATSGGLVQWDVATTTPHIFTTADGLV